MKVSFDFDGTLDKPSVQEYARELVERGHEVWITTARYEELDDYDEEFLKTYNIANLSEQHAYLFEVALDVGIKDEHIKFCNMVKKSVFLEGEGFTWHLDDDWQELKAIQKNNATIGISVFGNNTWKEKCERILKDA